MINAKKISAFTLVELSIVLIIIGFLISGVTAGRALIDTARLNSVISEKNDYTTALNSYKTRYNALPGDQANTTSLFSTAANNGNGNGMVEYVLASLVNEGFVAWQVLALGGYIPGTYTGLGYTNAPTSDAGNGTNTATGGNSPASKFPGGVWAFSHINSAYANYFAIAGFGLTSISKSGNVLVLGAKSSNNQPTVRLMTPLEAYQIDLKIDDGNARSGMILGANGCSNGTMTCTDTCQSSGTYTLSTSTAQCTMAFFYE